MATLTITTTAGQDSRIAPAFGDKLGLTQPGTNTLQNATGAQIKADIIEYIRNVVAQYEARQQVAAIVPTTPIAPT